MITLRLAWWQLRSSWRDGLFFVLAVGMCVLALVGVVATGDHVQLRLLADTRAMLAADLRLQASRSMEAFLENHVKNRGWRLAPMLEFSGHAMTEKGAGRLVEVKAVTGDYPLRGKVILTGGGSLAAALQGDGAVVESSLLSRLNIGIGDTIRLGEARFTVRDTLAQEPDRVTSLFSFGPRVLIPYDRVVETSLMQFGSRMRYITLLAVGEKEDARWVAHQLGHEAGKEGIRVVTPGDGQPQVRRFVERFQLFVTMMGLLAAGVAAVGLATAAASRLREQKAASVIVRTLGATRNQVVAFHVWQTLILGCAGSLLGALGGIVLPWVLLSGMGGLLPGMEVAYQPSWWLMGQGVLAGVVISLLLVVVPVWQNGLVKPVELFRSLGMQESFSAKEGWIYLIPLLLLAGAVVLAKQTGDRRLAGFFLAGCGGGIVVLWGLAKSGLWLLRRWRVKNLPLHLALQGLHRPQSGAMGVIVSLGLGLATLQSMILLKDNLLEQLQNHLPEKAPSFFFLDIQEGQSDSLQKLLASHAHDLRMMPVIRGRLTRLKGEEMTPQKAATMGESWRFEREYVLTWSDVWPKNNILVAGEWWRDAGQVGASVELAMAKALGLQVGDTLGFDIQGVVVEVPVTSIRKVRWLDLGLNFFVIFSPAAMAGAPGNAMATVSLPREREEEVLAGIARELPNVTAIPTRQVMESVAGLLVGLGRVITLVGGLAVGAGLLVLGSAVGANRRRRGRESAICRLLGATRGEMALAMGWEFFLLGFLASVAAMVVAQGITAVVIGVGMDDVWQGYWVESVLLVGAGGVGVALLGMWGAWREAGWPIRRVLAMREL